MVIGVDLNGDAAVAGAIRLVASVRLTTNDFIL